PDVYSPQAIPRERFTSPIGGRYQLFDILGSGGQGTVFAAWDLGPEGAHGPEAAPRPDLPRVAVKMYRPPENEQAAALIERQAAALRTHDSSSAHPYRYPAVRLAGAGPWRSPGALQ